MLVEAEQVVWGKAVVRVGLCQGLEPGVVEYGMCLEESWLGYAADH